jgi:hypothetical protein
VHDSYLYLTPIWTFLVVALVGFVGCDKLFGLVHVPDQYTPRNLTPTPGHNEITLDWLAPSNRLNQKDYRVKRRDPGGTYTTVGEVSDGTHFLDNSQIVDGNTYYYRVHTLIGNDERGTSSEVMVIAGLTGLKSLITTVNAGMPVNAFGGVVGMRITIGAADLIAKTVGRYKVPGNTRKHFVHLVDAATGMNIPMGGADIDMTMGNDNEFAYFPLPDAIPLKAGQSYYLVSQELNNGDAYYDSATTTVAVDSSLALVTSITAVNGDGTAGGYTTSTAEGFSYGPVDLQY